ncbi:MAG: POTRA domain-containing protein, partial [Pseudomonadota bacterium]
MWVAPLVAAAELVVLGIDGALKTNVESYLSISRQSCDAQAWRVRRAYEDPQSDVRGALEPYGYYCPIVESELEFHDDCWAATVNVEPGPRVTWRELDIAISGEAESDASFMQVLQASRLSPGAPLRHADWESFNNALQAKAYERGYVEAEFLAQRVDVWPEQQAADAELRFDSGPRYLVGDIDYEQRVLTPELISAYLKLTPGLPFDNNEISRAYRDLSDSGYFRRVEVTPAFDKAANGSIPIGVILEPAERIEYTVGAGFATDTGPRLRGGYRNRRVNRKGHRLNVDLTVSRVISGLTADYRQPIGDPRSDWMSYTAAIDVEDTDTFESEAGRVGVRRTRRMGTHWLRTLSIDFSYDRFMVADVRDQSRLLLPAVAFEYKRADADLYPNRGVRLSIELRAAHDALLSDTSLAQLIARGRWIHATSEHGRLLGRATVGATAKDDFSELPPSLRFFAGGDESIRGYDY